MTKRKDGEENKEEGGSKNKTLFPALGDAFCYWTLP